MRAEAMRIGSVPGLKRPWQLGLAALVLGGAAEPARGAGEGRCARASGANTSLRRLGSGRLQLLHLAHVVQPMCVHAWRHPVGMMAL